MTIRLLHVVVQPVFVRDDGETLTAGPETQPQLLTAAQLAQFSASLPQEIAALNAERGGEDNGD